MKALGYMRISKDDDGSISLDYQRAEIERLARAQGYDLIGIEVDNGISGKSIGARPAIQRVISAIKDRSIDAVIVYKSDRVSRDGIDSLQIEMLMMSRGIAYISATEGQLATGTLDDEFMSFIRAGLNQRERKLISMRTKAALQRKRERGERIGGQVQYGVRVVNKEAVVDEREKALVNRITALRSAGATLKTLTKTINDEGFTSRKGTPIHENQVVRILKRAQ